MHKISYQGALRLDLLIYPIAVLPDAAASASHMGALRWAASLGLDAYRFILKADEDLVVNPILL